MIRKFALATLVAASLGGIAAAAPSSTALNVYSSFLLGLEGAATTDQQAAIDQVQGILDASTSTKFSKDWKDLAKIDAILGAAYAGNTGYQSSADSAIVAVSVFGVGPLANQAAQAAAADILRHPTGGGAKAIQKIAKLQAKVDFDGNARPLEVTDLAANRKKFFSRTLTLIKVCEATIRRYG